MRWSIGSLMVLGLVGIAPSTPSADVGTESRARYANGNRTERRQPCRVVFWHATNYNAVAQG